MNTPVISQHARERCAEMGISTKVAKQIVQNADISRPGTQPDRMVMTSVRYPDYAVVYMPQEEVVVTVFYRDRFVRSEAGVVFVEEEES